ncbi:MAG: Hsp70 family protein [Victivallales bacterium]|nr:Hsp70 family protein [Victivallales bacterium]
MHSDNHTIYGIDLGTTYSAIAFINDDGKPEIIPNSDDERITPSVVFFEEPQEEGKVGHVVVGKIAQECAKYEPNRVISFIKKEMGTGWTKELDGITLNPEKVSSYILKRLAMDAKDMAGHDVKDVIITCPAYFGDAERKATIAAGQIAGLNVLQLLDEPVAAAMHYGLHKVEGEHTAIVYDLGGATFDVTVVAIEKGIVRVVCTNGNHRLGGKDWDERIVEYLATKFAEAHGIDNDALLGDTDTLFDLHFLAEIVKQTLTLRVSAKATVSFGGNRERIEITRETFDEMTKDLLDHTAELTQEMIDFAATRGITKIDDFLLVGGSTRMPQVMAMVKEKFGSLITNEPLAFEVDEAVAKGAALFGYLINAPFEDIEHTPGLAGDIIPLPTARHSYGIRLSTDSLTVAGNMIRKGEQLPAEREADYPMQEGRGGKMSFLVFTNDLTDKVVLVEDIKEVGEVVVRLPDMHSAESKVHMKLTLSEEGILSVNVSYLTITRCMRVEFCEEAGLGYDAINNARRDIANLEIN